MRTMTGMLLVLSSVTILLAAAAEEVALLNPVLSPSRIVYARPFTLERPYEHHWQWEKPVVRSGYVVVLDANPELVAPRASKMPVLYAGNHPVEVVRSDMTGRLIGIVVANEDLRNVPIWFGQEDFPEFVTEAKIEVERSRPDVKPMSEKEVSAALARGADTLAVSDRGTLLHEIERLARELVP